MLADFSFSPLCPHALIKDWPRDVPRGAWPATVQGLNAAFMDRPDVRRGFERDGRITAASRKGWSRGEDLSCSRNNQHVELIIRNRLRTRPHRIQRSTETPGDIWREPSFSTGSGS